MQFNHNGISTFRLTLIVGVAMLVFTAVVVFIWHKQGAAELSATDSALPTEEQKAYFRQLEFTDAHMSAAENFLGATVTYLDAQVTNKGPKTVRALDLDLTFVDMLNQIVLRETAHPITARTPPLNPGESRAFRITFEHMPAEWNQAPPTITPISLQF